MHRPCEGRKGGKGPAIYYVHYSLLRKYFFFSNLGSYLQQTNLITGEVPSSQGTVPSV